jgi:large subunit ribosomal protein L21
MAKLAVLKTGGKQYLVTEGQSIKIEKIRDKKGLITFSDIIFYADGQKSVFLPQKLKKSKVEGEIEELAKGQKVKIIKHKPKKGYLKRQGHRQTHLRVKIKKISLS